MDQECPFFYLVLDVNEGVLIMPSFLQVEDKNVRVLEGIEDVVQFRWVSHAPDVPGGDGDFVHRRQLYWRFSLFIRLGFNR